MVINNNYLRYLLLGLLALLFLGGAYFLRPIKKPEVGDVSVIYQCILKVSDGRWYILENATHTNSGCTGIIQSEDRLTVTYPEISYITFNVTQVDEILAKANIAAGSSVGLSQSDIYFSNKINPKSITNNNAAVFFEVQGVKTGVKKKN
jgi:hypothetical protein